MSGGDSSTEEDDSFLDLYSTKRVIGKYYETLEELKAGSLNAVQAKSEQNDGDGKKEKYETSIEITDCADSPEIITLDDSAGVAVTEEENYGLRRSARLTAKSRNSNLPIHSSATMKKRRNNRVNRRKSVDVIVIDDDNSEKINTADLSQDDIMNYEVSVKVIWKSISIKTFPVRRFQKLTKIFEHFATEENVSNDKILLTLNGKKLWPNDTPESIDLKVYDFIEGGVLTNSFNNSNKFTTQTKCSNDKDSVSVKIQDFAKNIFKFTIGKNEPFKSVMIRYAEQIEVPLEKIKFYFDGELLQSSATPITLDLDNDEIIDVKLIQ